MHNLSKWKKIDSHFPDIKQIISQKLLSEKLGDLGDAVRRHCLLCFLVSRCYLQDVMPCQWSSNDLPRVLRIWYSVFISQAFFTVHFFLLFSRLPWGGQFNLKVSRASYWSSKHSLGLTICLNHSNPQKRYIGRFYLRAKAGQPQNIKLHGELKYLLLTRFELFLW